MNFIIDVLSRKMSLRDVATKYDIDVDDVMDVYLQHKSQYTQSEIDEVMENVYIKN